MTKKIMLLPSVRSKFIKDEHMMWIVRCLYFLIGISAFTNWYLFGFMYAVKLVLMTVISIWLIRETEILFYIHDKDIEREESKELIKKSYPELTALIYVLLVPLGTPLWLVGVGAILATLLGKLLFGGFHHMVFHSSLVGVMFVTLGWSQVPDTAEFATSFDNTILQLMFDNNLFGLQPLISDPSNYQTSLEMMQSGSYYPFVDVLFGFVPGIIASGFVVLTLGIILMVKKYISYIIPVSFIISFLITSTIIALSREISLMYPIHQLFSGSVLFIVIFAATNPITSPLHWKGKIVFGVIAGSLTMLIRNGTEYTEGVLFAVLFMQMLTPMLNIWFPIKKKLKKPVPKKVVAS